MDRIIKKVSMVDAETKEVIEVKRDEKEIQKMLEEHSKYSRMAKKSFTNSQALETFSKYMQLGQKKIIPKEEAFVSGYELTNCIKYLLKKNNLDTLIQAMDMIIESDTSCTVTNEMFCYLDEDQKNYIFEQRPNYFEKMIQKEKRGYNYDLGIRSLKRDLTEQNVSKLEELIKNSK